MNLVSNAAEAQPRGGIIRISTANRDVDRLHRGFENIPPGTYALLKIEDRGTGIDREDLGKIFEPFYSKKKIGRSGTGLGMAVVWGAVRDHHGFIDIASSPENGTALEIYLPATAAEIAAAQTGPPVASYLGHGESILIVGDVAEQRLIGSEILQSLNYTVVTADSGEAALDYLKEHAVDLVILDMIMAPGIDGLETYKRAIKIRPALRAIIVSGFSETDRVKEAERLGAGRYLKKPYTRQSIGLAVKAELARHTRRIRFRSSP
jgi:two-component system, cell cycle sensor histidine kinase and response regulator CckA